MKPAERIAVVTMEREVEPDRKRNVASANTRRASRATWAQAGRLLLLVVAGLIALLGIVDTALAWKTRLDLSAAARAAAKVTIVTPLNAKNCGATPCSVESAAAAAKAYLLTAGLNQATCIDPQKPSFSGVLVWTFACDGTTSDGQLSNECDTSGSNVCVKVDMTAVEIRKDGTIVPYTKATVRYPHRWIMTSALKFLPERLTPHLPNSVAGTALLRNPA
jgi:Flp pilus assembly protein TadG